MSGSMGKNENKIIKLHIKNQQTGERAALGEFKGVKRTTLLDVMKQNESLISHWLGANDSNHVISLLYLRNKVPQDEWGTQTLSKFLCAQEGTFLITLVAEESIISIPRNNNPLEAVETVSVKKKENMSMDTALQLIQKCSFTASKECISTLLKYVEALLKFNIVGSEKYGKVRKINMANGAFKSRVGSIRGGIEFLVALGFTRDEQTLHLKQSDENYHWIIHGKELLEGALKTPTIKAKSLPSQQPSTKNIKTEGKTILPANFDPYASHNFNTQAAATGGKVNPSSVVPDSKYESRIERELKKLQTQAEKIELKNDRKALDRMLHALKPGDRGMKKSLDTDVNGETQKDGFLFAERLQRQEEARKKQEAGFTTKAMRDLEQMKKAKVYSHTQLRISFPSGHTLLCRFLPSEKVSVVKQIVRSSLVSDFSDEPFDLYISPPRQILVEGKSLTEERLVPAAKVHISWKTTRAASLSTTLTCIRSDLFQSSDDVSYPDSKIVSDELAAAEAQKRSSDGKVKKKLNEEDMIARMMGKTKSMRGESSSKKSSTSKPKWFK